MCDATMTYNLSGYVNLTSLDKLFIASNNLTDGWLFTIMLGILYLILMIVFKSYDTKSIMIADAMIVTFVAFLGWGIGLANMTVAWIPILAIFAAIMTSVLSE